MRKERIQSPFIWGSGFHLRTNCYLGGHQPPSPRGLPLKDVGTGQAGAENVLETSLPFN